MKVFISQPMNGLSDEEILRVRDEAVEEIKTLYSFFDKNNQLEIVSTIDADKHEILPKNAPRIWWLGRAIQHLADVDVVFFCRGWENARGCRVEKCVATEYNIGTYYQGEKNKK
jgi:hypothetical protein